MAFRHSPLFFWIQVPLDFNFETNIGQFFKNKTRKANYFFKPVSNSILIRRERSFFDRQDFLTWRSLISNETKEREPAGRAGSDWKN
jgi:hypothetical protein